MMKKNSLAKRYQRSYESKDSGGVKKGVMNYSNVEFYKPEEGRNRINIIPYTIKTKNHPLVKSGEFEIGEKDYLMDIWVHKNIGASESSVICLKKTYGKPCPICEQAEIFKKQGKDAESKALNSSRRAFYNVQDLKDGKLKVFETSHYLFEKELIDEARDGEDGYVNFADEEEGKEISFKASKEKKGKIEYLEFKSFRFEDREEPISDELLENAVSFDEIMNVPTYEQVEKILFGSDSDEDEPEEDEVENTSTKSVKRDSDEDEPEEKPKKAKGCEESEDDESKDSACPYSHKFGKDVDGFEECDNCTCWDKCCKEYNKKYKK
jgi:hypothetical protein